VKRVGTLKFLVIFVLLAGVFNRYLLSAESASAVSIAAAFPQKGAGQKDTVAGAVRFGHDILPILAANCFSCHGPDERNRKAGLRLDQEAAAKAVRPGGAPIVPGHPETSLIIARMTSLDPGVVMPPASSHRQVTPAQIELLRRWIAEGAKWGRHWSFEPIERPALAISKVSPIDQLVDRMLARNGLTRRPAAEPRVLVRRLWLDLIGLPPSPEVADRFAADPSPEAYRRLVDELLGRPQFGEHWARMWLDLARYADTKGYEKDVGRTIWPYRDWVINALNADMPLDRFTTEQLAGDLLPNPSESQLIATAFHRNTMTNDEGGTDNEEFRIAAVKDRVDTTMQVWMGLTMGCAKCHTHKYDPISHREYYSFLALFNQTEDADRSDEAPTIEMLSMAEKERRASLKARIEELDRQLPKLENPVDSAGSSGWSVVHIQEAKAKVKATLTIQKDNLVTVGGPTSPEETFQLTLALPAGLHTALRLEVLPERQPGGQYAVGRQGSTGNFVLSGMTASLTESLTDGRVEASAERALDFSGARADFAEKKGDVTRAIDGDEATGWSVESRGREPHTAYFQFAQPLRLSADGRIRLTLSFQNGDSSTFRRFRVLTTGQDPARLELAQASPELRKLIDDLAAAYEAERNFTNTIVQLPVMRELAIDKRRATNIHLRGNFLEPGEVVSPGVPASFHPFPAAAPSNRLGLAQWLVDRDNPLTPRVWANRVWARLAGAGLVETEEDFGAQGSAPVNPELLDWLAAEYRDRGWSLKSLIRTIVLSDGYKQASEITPSLINADARNLLLSRGARFRLSAETIRDQALSVSGLLASRMGGPPVMPPQPAGLWRSTYNGRNWIDADGEDRFRRGVYTYLKRTTPYPSMTTFDSGSGEVCQIRRIRTNTPLQALVTLNDPVYLEAAAGLARRMLTEAEGLDQRAVRGARLALVRQVELREVAPLVALYREMERVYLAEPDKAEALISATRAEAPAGTTRPAFAAWIVVANAILNLDEFLTRN
jgi:mono/diheme cytochrome c family protein